MIFPQYVCNDRNFEGDSVGGRSRRWFYPPSPFGNFKAYNVLVIASDIRQLEHIDTLPAPDITYTKGPGHAPIIARSRAQLWRNICGGSEEIGSKAISMQKIYEL